MSKETVKAQIDIDITNKTSSKSISPLNVGNNMKAVVDLIPDSGGSQDLQSVLENGSSATILGSIDINSDTFNINFPNYSEWNVGEGWFVANSDYSSNIYIGNTNLEIKGKNPTTQKYGNVYLGGGADEYEGFYVFAQGKSGLAIRENNSLIRLDLNAGDFTNKNLTFKFGEKPNGTYTLATLDDIKKIDLTGRIYENNAAALTGGLTANDVYRTVTGELRIVV